MHPPSAPLRSDVSRGDLLRALAGATGSSPQMLQQAAEQLGPLFGFDFVAPAREALPVPPAEREQVEESTVTEPPPEAAPVARPTLKFWRAESLRVKPTREVEEDSRMPEAIRRAPPVSLGEITFDGDPLPGQPLLPWRRLWPFLRTRLGSTYPSRHPDLDRVVRQLATGRPISRLPRKLRRAWHPRVHIWLDRRPDLAPFWDDYDGLIRRLKLMRGAVGVTVSQVRVATGDKQSAAIGTRSRFTREDYPLRGSVASPPPAPLPPLRPLRLPPSADAVLVLGDLGQYGDESLREPWVSMGRQLRNRGVVPWALCPVPRDRWVAAVAAAWNVAYWDRGQRLPVQGTGMRAQPGGEPQEVALARRRRLDALFTLASPSIRVERGLLRDLRFLLSASEANAGSEYDAFLAPEVRGAILGLTLQEDKAQALRRQFAELPRDLVAQVVALMRRHHHYCRAVFGHMETLGLHDVLSSEQYAALVTNRVLADAAWAEAEMYWRGMARTLHARPAGFDETSHFSFRDWQRLSGGALTSDQMQAIWAFANPETTGALPDSVEARTLLWTEQALPSVVEHPVILSSEALTTGPAARGFQLAAVRSGRQSAIIVTHAAPNAQAMPPARERANWSAEAIVLPAALRSASRIEVISDRETLALTQITRPYWAERAWYDREGLAASFGAARASHTFRWRAPAASEGGAEMNESLVEGRWEADTRPAWAQTLWVDHFGVAVAFRVAGVEFVLRWIPPGRFLMGSPPDEPGRWEHEGPQHEVMLTDGFWVGEAPVTQEQWRAVVETAATREKGAAAPTSPGPRLKPGPSLFNGPPTLPVEQVSWTDSVDFSTLLEACLDHSPGFWLPTEAQWEYACRAGTTTPPYSGGITVLGENNAPELDAIAWYGGNSGVDVEVSNPIDSTKWPEKQFDHSRAATHRVKLKLPNAWGLYDMIGNVWEWCADSWSEYGAVAVRDRAPDEAGALRVVRGGSWGVGAQGCRAACRDRGGPGVRGGSLGLRLFAGPAPEAAEPPSAERAGARAERERQASEARRKRRV